MFHKPTPEHDAFVKDGKRALKVMKLLCRVDFPDAIDIPDGPMIFAANHRSLLDVFVANAVLAKFDLSCHCLVRADYFDKPVIGSWLSRIGCIPMSSKTKEEAIARAVEKIDQGHLVAIMPEGRLMPEDEWIEGVGTARPGLSIIARAAHAEVVPVAMHNTQLVWARGRPLPLPTRKTVAVKLAPAMPLTAHDHQENVDQVTEVLRGLLKEIGTGSS